MSSCLQLQDQLERIDGLIGNIISKSKQVPMEGEEQLNRQLKECLNHRVKLVRIAARLKQLNDDVEQALHQFHNPPPPILISEAVKRAAKKARSRSVDETEDDDSEDTEELETQFFARAATRNRQMMRDMHVE